MELDDLVISRAIVERYSAKLLESLESDVAIAGGGPAGLTAATYLARGGARVVLFERKLSVGGGMWGGGAMMNEIVVQEEGKKILNEFGIDTVPYGNGYYTASSIEAVAALIFESCRAGATILNLWSVEDVAVREERVVGLVVNWSAALTGGLHVDPITCRSRYVIEATGHPSEVAALMERKLGAKFLTPSGKREGEGSMWAERGEQMILGNTREFYPGVYVCGMAANAVFGGPRMGPIFGGMLLSGKQVAELILENLSSERES